MIRYIDYGLTDKYPNKYHITPKSIKKLKILDWDRLKKLTWHNDAMTRKGSWWCHLEGCQPPDSKQQYDDEDEFWIGFNEENDKIDCHFTCFGGMCGYYPKKFYSVEEIGNKYDMNVQVNTIKWLNTMIDEGVLGLPMETE
jgi:hypothetical protein